MDLERAIQFILEAQAKLAAAQQRHDEQFARHEQQFARNEAQIARNSEQIASVADLVGRLAQAGIQLTADMRLLRETQTTTEESLHALIKIVDGLIRRNPGTS